MFQMRYDDYIFKSNRNKMFKTREKVINEMTAALKNYPATQNALLNHLEKNVKDQNIGSFQNKVQNLNVSGGVKRFEKILHGRKTDGIKPDIYILERGGRICCEASYHYLRKIILEKYGVSLTTYVISNKDKECIIHIDIFNKRIVFDSAKYTKIHLSEDVFPIDEFYGVIVQVTKLIPGSDVDSQDVKQVLYRKGDLEKASAVFGNTVSTYSTPSTLNGNKKEEHKNIQMNKKTAIRMYIRENFEDLSELDYLDETDDYTSEESIDDETFALIEKELIDASTLENLKDCGLKIRTLKISVEQRKSLLTLYSDKKKTLTLEKVEEPIVEKVEEPIVEEVSTPIRIVCSKEGCNIESTLNDSKEE